MESRTTSVKKILEIYLKKGHSQMDKHKKALCITGLFDYLSTAEVKPLLHMPAFGTLRTVLLAKIHEFKNDPYILARQGTYHRLNAVMDELFTYLVMDDSVPRRRSERQKKQTVQLFNARFQECPCADCDQMTAELKYWNAYKPGAPLPPITVKVLPRRSARLMAQ